MAPTSCPQGPQGYSGGRSASYKVAAGRGERRSWRSNPVGSRTGENPPYGILEGEKETSAWSGGSLPRSPKGRIQRKPIRPKLGAPSLYSVALMQSRVRVAKS